MQKSVQPNVVNFPVDGFYKVCANVLGVISGVKVFFFFGTSSTLMNVYIN
jgi:uncharacterized membrane protein YgaE (UPF0421/DUF939 family)